VGIYAIKTLSDVGKQSKMQGMAEWQAFLRREKNNRRSVHRKDEGGLNGSKCGKRIMVVEENGNARSAD
jgi:hypothetical protein